MASSLIPANIVLGLTKIATLPDESFRELISTFEKFPLVLKQGVIFEDIDLHLEFLSLDEAEGIKEAVIPIYRSAADRSVPETFYIEGIVQAIKSQEQEGLEWIRSEELLEKFKDRLTQLAGIEALQLVVKAHKVLTAHSQTYSEGRILSDIRLVFGESVEDSPKGALIVHMLNLGYHRDKERHEFVVALDTKDVEDLIVILERAKAKTESLKSVIASTKLPYIEVK